jgi:hypothetical protein
VVPFESQSFAAAKASEAAEGEKALPAVGRTNGDNLVEVLMGYFAPFPSRPRGFSAKLGEGIKGDQFLVHGFLEDALARLVELVDVLEADDDGVNFGHGHGEAEGLGAFLVGLDLIVAINLHADDGAAFFRPFS